MDRITKIIICNVRAIEALELELGDPITVLIGENGAGKSTIIECMELLREAAEPNFMQRFYTLHRGMSGLLRKGATSMTLGLVIKDDEGTTIEYSFSLASQGAMVEVIDETVAVRLASAPEMLRVVMNRSAGTVLHGGFDKNLDLTRSNRAASSPEQLALSGFGAPNPNNFNGFDDEAPNEFIKRLIAALRGIEAHVGFETRASWVARSYQRTESLRGASTLFPAQRLELMGVNLANAWWELQSRASSHWDETMEIVRLGLGERVDKVIVTPDPGGGNVYLSVRFKDMAEPVVAANLSDGQLSWLGFVAMVRLNERRSLLAIDEPELHMHPALLGRVISLLTSAGAKAPVLVSSHSDRVLELLDDPADALRVCSMEGSRAVLSRIDADKLTLWLKQFGDLGQLRASGYLPRVLEATQKGDT